MRVTRRARDGGFVMQVYEAIVRGLESLGVQTAFGGNGENIASLTLALDRSKTIRPILTRHEQAAAYMACGYSMFTKNLGVCFATVGPGAFNMITGLAVAMSDCYPVLALTGYIDTRWEGRGAVNDTSGRNPTPDSQALFAATTKRSFKITDVDQTCDLLEEAVNIALEGRPGPVQVAVAQNLTHPHVHVPDYHDPRLSATPPQPDTVAVEEIAAALATALAGRSKVLLLAGFGAVHGGAQGEVKRFAERFQVPVVTKLDGKGVIAEDHRLCVGVFSESGHASAWKAFREADVVLAVGNSLNQHATFGLSEDLFDDKTLIQVNISAEEIGKFYPVDHGLVSDARPGLAAITDALAAKIGPLPPVDVDGQDYQARHIPHVTGNIHPGQLAQMMGAMLPPSGVILADAGAHLAWLGYYLELEEGQNFCKCGTFGPMAAHTNADIGLKAAQPHRTVVVGCGRLLRDGRVRADDRGREQPAGDLGDLQRRPVQARQALPARELRQDRSRRARSTRLRRLCPRLRGRRVHRGLPGGVPECIRRGARLTAPERHRREDHPLGAAALQQLPQGDTARHLGDA